MERHNVFVSYHHANDQYYRDKFERLFNESHDILVSKSVKIGDIDSNLPADKVRQIIRDEYLRSTSVTVVLIGEETWKRKHVDWEIGASIRKTKYNSRSGLVGIILPSHPDYGKKKYTPNIIPPRLFDNIECEYSNIYDWNTNPETVQAWIHEAFLRRNKITPDNSYQNFKNNRNSDAWQ